jgi:hypothetical protein
MRETSHNPRSAYAATLIKDAERHGWRLFLGEDGRLRLERQRQNAEPLSVHLRFWIKDHACELRLLLYRERSIGT